MLGLLLNQRDDKNYALWLHYNSDQQSIILLSIIVSKRKYVIIAVDKFDCLMNKGINCTKFWYHFKSIDDVFVIVKGTNGDKTFINLFMDD